MNKHASHYTLLDFFLNLDLPIYVSVESLEIIADTTK